MKELNYNYPTKNTLSILSEPELLYITKSKVTEFSIGSFSTLSSQLIFSQQDWAEILNISDRTLQRYIKDNKPFEGLYAEHLYQLEIMAELGLSVFSTPENLKSWLIKPKQVLGNILDFHSLSSFWGVKLICNELGRMIHGVYI